MAEAEPVKATKKKGKLPLILAAVVLFGGGGFFAMKGKGGEPKEPEIALGETVDLGEFLVNLSDGTSYLKTNISVQIAKEQKLDEHAGGGGHGGPAAPPAPVRDAVVAVLSSQGFEQINTEKGRQALKRALAKAINMAVHAQHSEKDEGKDGKKKKKGHDEKPEVVDPTWDDQVGPVLKVYFTSFATQS